MCVILSSNMAASIATEINFHLCKHVFTLLCVTVSPLTSPFVVQGHDRVHVRVTALDIQVSLHNPMAMLEDSMTSVKTLYTERIQAAARASQRCMHMFNNCVPIVSPGLRKPGVYQSRSEFGLSVWHHFPRAHGVRAAQITSHTQIWFTHLKTLFNIVEAPFNFFLNFEVCVVWWCSDGPINSQGYKSFEIMQSLSRYLWLNITTE